MKRKKLLDKDTVHQILAAIQLLSNLQDLLSEVDLPSTHDEAAARQQPTKATPEQFFNEEFVSIIEAHKRFGYPRATLYRLAKSDELKTVLIGKRKRVTTRQWIDDCFASLAGGGQSA